jgi:hypothetical protein
MNLREQIVKTFVFWILISAMAVRLWTRIFDSGAWVVALGVGILAVLIGYAGIVGWRKRREVASKWERLSPIVWLPAVLAIGLGWPWIAERLGMGSP